MEKLLEVMRRLRGPGGCPWDREQTHESLRPYLLEEAAEAVDALSREDSQAVAEELGDVLLQIAFHAVIAEEAATFRYHDIESAIVDKLIRRHPHVFSDTKVAGAAEVVRNWQAIKAGEKAQPDGAEAVPRSLPALMRASRLGKVLAWPPGTAQDVERALAHAEVDPSAIGALLLAVVDYARARDVDPELALREAMDARAAQQANIEP
jgi:XTP/dITP diphosphohydrolase